jgi:hypothetical protein
VRHRIDQFGSIEGAERRIAMYHMKNLDRLAAHRAIAPAPLLSSPLDAARAFVRWWGDHQAWPANEPTQLKRPR